ncbi:restriction endonuclease [Listeria monocytogenes]|nr:restriction endonuclease [Listeria monocytogenes]
MIILDWVRDNAFLFLLLVITVLCTRPVVRQIRKARWKRKFLKSGIRDVDRMNGLQFEHFVGLLLAKLGYRSKVTKSSGDFGADVVLEGKDRIMIQCKRYRRKEKVGIAAVQQIFAARAFYDAKEAWVITNNVYSPSAKKLAFKCGVTLIDRIGLCQMILKLHPDESARQVLDRNEFKGGESYVGRKKR